ncbi:MAG: response regulator of the LytR/AlgR family [Haloplasmataceae bacterium]|jgi:DNA-binding LytR/AlgR family response regulator|nr:response regulator of the LytR/AlgR family [Haloplasmataceae bacterium]
MKVELKIDSDILEEKVVIYARESNEEIINLMNRINSYDFKRITGILNEKIYLVSHSDIYYFYTENQKVYVRTEKNRYEIKMKMYEIEEQFQHSHFVRISQSVIANINKINNLELSFNGTLCFKFNNGDTEYSSRRYVKKIKETLGI